MPYIVYTKRADGDYARVVESERDGKTVKQKYICSLGRVVDRTAGIFKNRKNGIFHYDIENGFTKVSSDYELPEVLKLPSNAVETEKLILDFGNSFILNEYLKRQNFYEAFLKVIPEETDTLMSCLFYRIQNSGRASLYIEDWYQGNYVRELFPKAKLSSQRLSEFMVRLGEESVQRRFFRYYLEALYGETGGRGILIDNTGVPNATKMEVTQLSNHNGEINVETRLIYAVDRNTGMPVYFRHVAGNIIDVTTLRTTLAELEQYKIKIDCAIVDAGYYCEDNIEELYEGEVHFISRLAPNRKLYKQVVSENLDGLTSSENALRYGRRLVYIKAVEVNLGIYKGYAYIGIDHDSRTQQFKRAVFTALDDKLSPEETDARVEKLGLFVIISSDKISREEILPLYYTRQQVEQVFDICKHNASLLPIRVQSEDTFRGHLMLTFLATAVIQRMQRELIEKQKGKKPSKQKLNPEGVFFVSQIQKCKVYEENIIPQEPGKTVNDIYHALGIESPIKIRRTVV